MADTAPLSGPTVITLGCRLNTYESEVMRRHAQDAGLEDAVIINTCAVTSEAVRGARQAIRRAARENPGAPIDHLPFFLPSNERFFGAGFCGAGMN